MANFGKKPMTTAALAKAFPPKASGAAHVETIRPLAKSPAHRRATRPLWEEVDALLAEIDRLSNPNV